MSTKFKVVRGTEENIQEMPYIDGFVYFAVDSGRMYLDARGENPPPLVQRARRWRRFARFARQPRSTPQTKPER